MAMNHAREAEVDVEIACERDGTILALRGHAHVDMGAYMRTNGAVGARNIAQFMSGPYRIPHVKLDVSLWMTNKTPVGTYRGPGRFESRFLPRAAVRHGGAGPRHRPRRVPPQESRLRWRRCRIRSRPSRPTSTRTNTTAATIAQTLDRCLKEIALGREGEAAGRADRRPLSRPRRRLLHRRRRGRPEGDRAARDQRRRLDLGLHGLVGGRAGRRDGVRADRRRRARNSDGSHPLGASRLDRLCAATATAPIIRARS